MYGCACDDEDWAAARPAWPRRGDAETCFREGLDKGRVCVFSGMVLGMRMYFLWLVAACHYLMQEAKVFLILTMVICW